MQYNENWFVSFGGGVQSSAIAVLALHFPELLIEKKLEVPKYWIFCDTGAEKPQTLENVERIFSLLRDRGFECFTTQLQDKEGNKVSILETYDEKRKVGGLNNVPWYVTGGEKATGQLSRQCTGEFKVTPFRRKVKEIMGVKSTKGKEAYCVIGISVDEAPRAKPSDVQWLQNRYPLLELGLDRTRCAMLLYKHLGFVPPKSSCVFCPYTSKNEWMDRKQNDPKSFALAVEIDEKLRSRKGAVKSTVKGTPYAHSSCIPLKDLSSDNQMSLDLESVGFIKECTGFCST